MTCSEFTKNKRLLSYIRAWFERKHASIFYSKPLNKATYLGDEFNRKATQKISAKN